MSVSTCGYLYLYPYPYLCLRICIYVYKFLNMLIHHPGVLFLMSYSSSEPWLNCQSFGICISINLGADSGALSQTRSVGISIGEGSGVCTRGTSVHAGVSLPSTEFSSPLWEWPHWDEAFFLLRFPVSHTEPRLMVLAEWIRECLSSSFGSITDHGTWYIEMMLLWF